MASTKRKLEDSMDSILSDTPGSPPSAAIYPRREATFLVSDPTNPSSDLKDWTRSKPQLLFPAKVARKRIYISDNTPVDPATLNRHIGHIGRSWWPQMSAEANQPQWHGVLFEPEDFKLINGKWVLKREDMHGLVPDMLSARRHIFYDLKGDWDTINDWHVTWRLLSHVHQMPAMVFSNRKRKHVFVIVCEHDFFKDAYAKFLAKQGRLADGEQLDMKSAEGLPELKGQTNQGIVGHVPDGNSGDDTAAPTPTLTQGPTEQGIVDDVADGNPGDDTATPTPTHPPLPPPAPTESKTPHTTATVAKPNNISINRHRTITSPKPTFNFSKSTFTFSTTAASNPVTTHHPSLHPSILQVLQPTPEDLLSVQARVTRPDDAESVAQSHYDTITPDWVVVDGAGCDDEDEEVFNEARMQGGARNGEGRRGCKNSGSLIGFLEGLFL
ncbi:hypothetical protein M011DRAFT_75995 [Sporormia fimetaria CBS 119925]|uniref:Uncharacterized protein n=1 Tax=Sporormia fimetaria CBS 119925 TaxID=1340428 RepID=A0A6A6VAA9_9PLEO|nr:hypothetical protein M011DRAFT_75995 [Sporormia fimetaria CBS 119925]